MPDDDPPRPPRVFLPTGLLTPPHAALVLGGIPICAITLPDDTPLAHWVGALVALDAEATQAMQGRYAVPGGEERAEITYPELRGISGVNWVYIVWRSLVRMRHRATSVAVLTDADIAEMGAGAARMTPGARYQWVFARPQLLRTPFGGPPFSPCFGTIRFHDDPEPPRWSLLMRTS